MIFPVIVISVIIIALLVYFGFFYKGEQSENTAAPMAVEAPQPVTQLQFPTSPLDDIPTNSIVQSIPVPPQTLQLSKPEDVTWSLPTVNIPAQTSSQPTASQLLNIAAIASTIPSSIVPNPVVYTPSPGQVQIPIPKAPSLPAPIPSQVQIPIPTQYKVTQMQALPNFLKANKGSKLLDMKCSSFDKGTYIQGIDVNSGNYLDSITIRCSDGVMIGPQGGSGGKANPTVFSANNEGFRKYKLKSGGWIDNFTIFNDSNRQDVYYSFGGPGGSDLSEVDCGPGKRLAGFSGTYDQYINQLNTYCIDVQPTPI